MYKKIALLILVSSAILSNVFAGEKIKFNGKKYDLLKELNAIKVNVYLACVQGQIKNLDLASFQGPENSAYFPGTLFTVENENEVYYEKNQGQKIFIGNLDQNINLDNASVISSYQREKCTSGDFYFDTIAYQFTLTPDEEISLISGIKEVKCDYDPSGIEFAGDKKVTHVDLYVTQNKQNKKNVIYSDSTKFHLPPYKSCVSIKSFFGGVFRTVEAPFALLIWLLIGAP